VDVADPPGPEPRYDGCMRALIILLALAIPLAHSADGPMPPPADNGRSGGNAIAVLDFELNDLTLDPNNATERERTASIRPMLQEALTAHDFRTVDVDSAAQSAADQGVGYLFDHPDIAASLGKEAGADWIVVGRVHKSSFLFAYLKAHVVNAHTGEQVGDLVVEVKGPQQTLTRRGVDALAQQIADTTRSEASQK
jgi:hypothetical protein